MATACDYNAIIFISRWLQIEIALSSYWRILIFIWEMGFHTINCTRNNSYAAHTGVQIISLQDIIKCALPVVWTNLEMLFQNNTVFYSARALVDISTSRCVSDLLQSLTISKNGLNQILESVRRYNCLNRIYTIVCCFHLCHCSWLFLKSYVVLLLKRFFILFVFTISSASIRVIMYQ